MKTALLMGVVIGLFAAIGCIVGMLLNLGFGVNPFTVVAVLIGLAVVVTSGTYRFCDRIILKMYDTAIVSENIAPELYSRIFQLSSKAGLPVPRIGIINNETPNAFATGRTPENAVVAVTSGALSLLRRDELEGVLAHELAHIKNGDMFISTLAAVTASIVFPLKWVWTGSETPIVITQVRRLLQLLFVPCAALLIRLAVPQNSEYSADETGAAISGNPSALADALVRIDESVTHSPLKHGSPATSHLFIVNPFRTKSFVRLLFTAPPTELRVQRLREMTNPSLE